MVGPAGRDSAAEPPGAAIGWWCCEMVPKGAAAVLHRLVDSGVSRTGRCAGLVVQDAPAAQRPRACAEGELASATTSLVVLSGVNATDSARG